MPPLSQPFSDTATAALDASLPDWTRLWEYVEMERIQGSLRARPEWNSATWRSEMQAMLMSHNKWFVHLSKKCIIKATQYPSHDRLCMASQRAIEEAFAAVEALPAELQDEVGDDLVQLSSPCIEELHARGKAVTKQLAQGLQKEGEEMLAAAAKTKGAGRKKLCDLAQQNFVTCAYNTDTAVQALASSADIAMLDKE